MSGREWRFLSLLLVSLWGSMGLSAGSFALLDGPDEGVYLAAGQMILQGRLPYRDFLLAHPPLVPLLASLALAIGGSSVLVTRWLAAALTVGGSVPLFLLARRASRSWHGGLLAASLYPPGLLCLCGMGRTMRLEPATNLLLLSGAALYLLSRSRISGVCAGLSLGLAVGCKLVAAIPILMLLFGELMWGRREDPKGRRAWFVVGAAAALAPLGLVLFSEPGFLDWAVRAQARRPVLGLGYRCSEVAIGLARFPPMAVGLVLAIRNVFTRQRRLPRAVSLIGLGSTIALVTLFGSFYRYYLALPLPWLLLVSVLGLVELTLQTRLRSAFVVSSIAVGLAAPALFNLLLDRKDPAHAASWRAVEILREGNGPVFTDTPVLALWAKRPLVPDYFAIDNHLPTIVGRLHDSDVAISMDGAAAVVLSGRDKLDAGPLATRALEASFERRDEALPIRAWVRRAH